MGRVWKNSVRITKHFVTMASLLTRQPEFCPKYCGKTIEELANRVLGYVTGSGIGAMIFLGDQVGLYRAMDGAGSLTSHQVAERAGLHPRWVQEWLHTQVCAGLLHYDNAHKTYALP